MMNWQTVDLPFGAGLGTKPDKRVLAAPKLTRADNVQFTDSGGLQKRRPFEPMNNLILGGGTLSDVRKLAVRDDELLAFTKESLYSWSPNLSRWVLRDTHLAVDVVETPRVTNASDQRSCDMAQVGNIQIIVWTEFTTNPYVAAVDVDTGSYVYGPVAWPGDGADANFVRAVSLGDKALILLGESLNGDIFGAVVDPEDIDAGVNATFTVNSASDALGNFDVAVGDGVAFVVWPRTTSTAYGLARITDAGAVTRQTEARTADGRVAIAARGSLGAHTLCVMRTEGANIDADLFTELAAGTVGTVVGTEGDDQLTCEWRSVPETGSTYRCYGFWSQDENDANTDFETKYNYIDTAGATGSEANLVKTVGVASQAFDYNGRIFVWLAFASSSSSGGLSNPLGLRAALQNAYFLVRDDGLLISRAASPRAGGFSAINNHLPTVQNIAGSSYKWMGIERRIIPLGDQDGPQRQTGYAARSPIEVAFGFDADEARRAAQLGRTLYISGGQLSMYDGEAITEVGFPIAPWYWDALELGTGSPAIPADQTHSYKITWSWENAVAELDRSTVAGIGQGTTSATARWQLDIQPLPVTLKQSANSRRNCAVEVWRTKTDPIPESPFYLTTSKDPTVTSGENRYIENDATAITLSSYIDNFTDAIVETKEPNRENGQVLENIAPPGCRGIFANDERLFAVRTSDDGDSFAYSLIRNAGEVAGFHPNLVVQVPREGGDITAVEEFFGNLIVFKESAVYSLPGIGFDNLGLGVNYGPAQVVASDVGAVGQDGVAVTPVGLIFKSKKGWYVFDRGFTVRYIGADIAAFDGETVVSTHVLEDVHELRAMTTERCLVFDYTIGQWASWTLEGAVDAIVWDGRYVYATDDRVYIEAASFDDAVVDYSMVIETAWFKPTEQLQDFVRCSHMSLLGERVNPCSIRVEVGRNYDEDYFQTKVKSLDDDVVLMRHALSKQKLTAVRFRLTDLHTDKASAPDGEGLKLSGIALRVGLKTGLAQRGAARKQ